MANYIAWQARENSELRDVVRYVNEFLNRQEIRKEDLEIAAEKGWPVIDAVAGPSSYFYAALRLVGHNALRNPSLIDNFEARVADVKGLSANVRQNIDDLDRDWASALTLVAAEMASESGEFRSRLIAAAKDFQALVSGDEVPTWSDFAEGPRESTWPPLRLGILPILGGKWKEQDRDYEGAAGGAAIVTIVGCTVGFGAGRGAAAAVCIVGVIVLIIAFLAIFA